MTSTAEDYAWFAEDYPLGSDFCLTFIRGVTPDQVLERLSGREPVELVGANFAPYTEGGLAADVRARLRVYAEEPGNMMALSTGQLRPVRKSSRRRPKRMRRWRPASCRSARARSAAW